MIGSYRTGEWVWKLQTVLQHARGGTSNPKSSINHESGGQACVPPQQGFERLVWCRHVRGRVLHVTRSYAGKGMVRYTW
jgi:hypothetical protein